jgi:hypothetical protein
MLNPNFVRALEFHGFAPFLETEEDAPSFPETTPPPNEQVTVQEGPDKTQSAISTADPQQTEELEVALFLTKELLQRAAFSKLEITDHEAQRLSEEAILKPLPSGWRLVTTLKGRLKESLVALKRKRRAAMITQKAKAAGPKRPRLRPTLRFDHKSRIAPSKAIESAGQLFENTLGQDTYPSREDDMIEFEARLGSENEDALADQIRNQELLDRAKGALSVLLGTAASGPQSCSQCGKLLLTDGPRSTILRVHQPNSEHIGAIEQIAVHCEKCCGTTVQGIPRAEEDPHCVDLSADEYFAYCSQKQGLNQTEIGAQMTPPRSQATVSRILQQAQVKLESARLQRFRTTGGA